MFGSLKYCCTFEVLNHREKSHTILSNRVNLIKIALVLERSKDLHRSYGGSATPLQGLFMLILTLNKLLC